MDAADDFFSHLPDTLSISNIKIQGKPLPASPSARSLHRRKSGAQVYNVFYNGSLPLTFMVHRSTSASVPASASADDDQTEQHFVPLFAATDGAKMWLTHVAPISHVASAPGFGALEARDGYDEYNHVGAGGIKLLANSDPVATWDDVMNWLNSRTEDGGTTPFQYVSTMASFGTYVGHSFVHSVHGVDGWGYNAQFAMEGYDHVCFLPFSFRFSNSLDVQRTVVCAGHVY